MTQPRLLTFGKSWSLNDHQRRMSRGIKSTALSLTSHVTLVSPCLSFPKGHPAGLSGRTAQSSRSDLAWEGPCGFRGCPGLTGRKLQDLFPALG